METKNYKTLGIVLYLSGFILIVINAILVLVII